MDQLALRDIEERFATFNDKAKRLANPLLAPKGSSLKRV
jgi:hypothetical protein